MVADGVAGLRLLAAKASGMIETEDLLLFADRHGDIDIFKQMARSYAHGTVGEFDQVVASATAMLAA